MKQQPSTQPAELLALAQSLTAANSTWNSDPALDPMTAFLSDVRRALGMEVAFVSRISHGSRIIEALSVDANCGSPLSVGDADELDETYCQMILDGELDPIVKDAGASPLVARLEVTQRLKIRSYVSATVVLRSGRVFGTLCCYSTHARSDLQSIDAAALQAVADAIATDIDRHGKLTSRIWQW